MKRLTIVLLAALLLLASCGRKPAPAPETGLLLALPEGCAAETEAAARAAAEGFPGVYTALAAEPEIGAAMDAARDAGVRVLAVQPMETAGGAYFAALYSELALRADAFDAVVLGTPLLTAEEDFAAAAEILAKAAAEYADPETAVVFVGRGEGGDDDYVYGLLQQTLTEAGHVNLFVGAAGSAPGAEDAAALLRAGGHARAVLLPLDFVSGAADADFAALLAGAGIETLCPERPLCALEGVRERMAAHARDALDWAVNAAKEAEGGAAQ